MGSLILCHSRRARQPYEILRAHVRIYTLEELCYYLCNNLYLIDYTLMNRALCDWLDEELGLTDLADELKEKLSMTCSEEQFVLTILNRSHIYGESELAKMEATLEHLKNQRDVEKQKYKADSLMNSGAYADAALVYQSMLNDTWDESVDRQFYGRVYACLGSAFGRLFLYQDAAEAYQKAYDICDDEDMARAYLYCLKKTLPKAEYDQVIKGNGLFENLERDLKKEIRDAKRSEDLDLTDQDLEAWKKAYR